MKIVVGAGSTCVMQAKAVLHNAACLFHLEARLRPILGEVRQLLGVHRSTALPSNITQYTDTPRITTSTVTSRKSFPSHTAQGGAGLHFRGPQPDTSLHCQTTDTGLVHRAVCLFTPQLSLVLICTYPRRDGQAEFTWVAGDIPGWFSRP